MMVPNLTSTGSGSGVPGPRGPEGKSTYELAVGQGFEGTLDQWLLTQVGPAGPKGEDGDPGQQGPKGDKGSDADITVADGSADIGTMRLAWGLTDASTVGVKTVVFPAPFAAPPVVQLSAIGLREAIVPRQVTTTGFVMGEVGADANAAPIGWFAVGLNPSVSFIPSAQFNIPKLPIWSAAVRAQRTGKRNARVLCLGDSTTAGTGSLGPSNATNDISASYPTQLAARLTARGSYASWGSYLGTCRAPNITQFDSRIGVGLGWSDSSGLGQSGLTLGARYLYSSGNNTKGFFAPTQNVDTFEVYTIAFTTSGTPSVIVSIDNVDVATVSALSYNVNPGALRKTVVKAASSGQHTVQVRADATTSTIAFCAIIAYDSAVKEVSVLNAGWISGKSGDLNNGHTMAWSPLTVLPTYNPDLVLINMMINDLNTAVPKETYNGNMQAVIDSCRSSGADVVLIKPNRLGLYDASWPTYAGYVDELATRNGLLTIDISSVLGSYDTAVANGDMRDVYHMTSQGYSKIATTIADVIMPIGA
ncbi:GDSL-type esterase/lipase family protein [Rhizobium ruizarguesonis]